MPAAIDASTRGDIVYYAALGYSQQAVADAVGVSRNTVRKYLELTREIVEDAEEPRERLCAVLEGTYDWDGRTGSEAVRLDFMSM